MAGSSLIKFTVSVDVEHHVYLLTLAVLSVSLTAVSRNLSPSPFPWRKNTSPFCTALLVVCRETKQPKLEESLVLSLHVHKSRAREYAPHQSVVSQSLRHRAQGLTGCTCCC